MLNIRRFHPGVYLKDDLEVLNMSAREFSARSGISERVLSPFINGKTDITFDLAYKLSAFFGNSIDTWMKLQQNYDLYKRNLSEEKNKKKELELAKKLENYLVSNSFITSGDTKDELIKDCRETAGVNNLALLTKKDPFICLKRAVENEKTDTFLQNFWIAFALTEARKKIDLPFNKNKLILNLLNIRKLTVQDPLFFYPELERIFKECGVAFVLLPYIPKSNIYGLTKWFNKDHVMIAISNRGMKAHLFWETLFHELAHLLMEHKRVYLFNLDGEEDKDAESIMNDLLIPKNEYKEFVNKKVFTKESILEFGVKNEVLPSIVLERLHKEKRKIENYKELEEFFHSSYKITIKPAKRD